MDLSEASTANYAQIFKVLTKALNTSAITPIAETFLKSKPSIYYITIKLYKQANNILNQQNSDSKSYFHTQNR